MQNKYFKNFLIMVLIVFACLLIKFVINMPSIISNFTQKAKTTINGDMSDEHSSVDKIMKVYNDKNFDYMYDELVSIKLKKAYAKEDFKNELEKLHTLTGKCISYDMNDEISNIKIDYDFINDKKIYTINFIGKFESNNSGNILIRYVQKKNSNPQITTFSITLK